MAKKIVRNAGIVAVAGAAVIGSNIPANAFAEVPAATDLSYDYSSYEYDYSSYQTPATSYVAPQAEQQTEYVAPAQTAQVETTSAQAPAAAPADQAPAPTTNNATRDSIVSAAKAAQGTGYVWGGRSYGAWDCSGFTSWVFAQHGIKLTAFTYAMKNELRPTSNPQPGDIVSRTATATLVSPATQDDLRSEPPPTVPWCTPPPGCPLTATTPLSKP